MEKRIRDLLRLIIAVLLLISSANAAEIDVFDLISDADASFSKGDLDKALATYLKITALEKDNVYALNRIALIYAKKLEAPKTREVLEQVLKIEPDNTFAHYWLGTLDLMAEKSDDAFSHFTRIIEQNPADSNAAYAHMFLGAIYTFRHQPNQAIMELKKARDKADKPEVHYKLARAYHDAGMVANAALEYIKTLQAEPDNLAAIDGLGWVFYVKGEREQAIALWEKGVVLSQWKHRDLKDNLAKAYNDLALEQYQKSNITQARALWQKVLTYDSGNKAAQHFLQKVKQQ
jgi:tetratricopeptide (TPR) repeat protein